MRQPINPATRRAQLRFCLLVAGLLVLGMLIIAGFVHLPFSLQLATIGVFTVAAISLTVWLLRQNRINRPAE